MAISSARTPMLRAIRSEMEGRETCTISPESRCRELARRSSSETRLEVAGIARDDAIRLGEEPSEAHPDKDNSNGTCRRGYRIFATLMPISERCELASISERSYTEIAANCSAPLLAAVPAESFAAERICPQLLLSLIRVTFFAN